MHKMQNLLKKGRANLSRSKSELGEQNRKILQHLSRHRSGLGEHNRRLLASFRLKAKFRFLIKQTLLHFLWFVYLLLNKTLWSSRDPRWAELSRIVLVKSDKTKKVLNYQILASAFVPARTRSRSQITLRQSHWTHSPPASRAWTSLTPSWRTLPGENSDHVILTDLWRTPATISAMKFRGQRREFVMKVQKICQRLVRLYCHPVTGANQHCQRASVMRYSMNLRKRQHSTNLQTGALTMKTNLKSYIRISNRQKKERGTQGSVGQLCLSLTRDWI